MTIPQNKVVRPLRRQASSIFLTSLFLVTTAFSARADSTDSSNGVIGAASTNNEQPSVVLIADTASVASSTLSTAQTDDLIKRLDMVTKRLDKIEKSTPTPVWLLTPGLTSNVPSANGAGKGITGVGFGFQERTRFTNKRDGTAALLIGFGDPEKVGFDLQLSLLDLSNPGSRQAIGFKLHKQLKNDYSVAFGAENLLTRGGSDSGRSFYTVVSKKLRLQESSRKALSRVYLTGGIGSGRFRSETNVINDSGSLNIFGSAAVNLSASTIVFTEWTGQALNIGASFVPSKTIPLVITPALADIGGPAGDGTRFTLSVGYLLQY